MVSMEKRKLLTGSMRQLLKQIGNKISQVNSSGIQKIEYYKRNYSQGQLNFVRYFIFQDTFLLNSGNTKFDEIKTLSRKYFLIYFAYK